MTGPRLSILMAVYNASEFIEWAVNSILEQTFDDWELLVCDDASNDNSLELLNSFDDTRIKVFSNGQNKGKTATINSLYQKAEGYYLTIHDADDISYVDRFSKQIDFLEKNPDAVMCGCSFESFTQEGFNGLSVMPNDFDLIKREIIKHSQFHGPTMVVRKQAIDQGLNGELLRPFFKDYNEDCDLAIRLTEIGLCTNLTSILYKYRILPNSLSKSITPRKKCLYDMLVLFHHQRLDYGEDDLQRNNLGSAEERLEKLISERYSDPSLIFRQQASFFMHYQWKYRAVNAAWKALRQAPLKMVNWRTLQYCVRQLLIGV